MPTRQRTLSDSSDPQKQREQGVRAIRAALQSGHAAEAARLLMRLVEGRLVPHHRKLATWLVSAIGRNETAKLVDAFVHLPCFYCAKGRLPCHVCESRGHLPTESVCPRCLGAGVERCDFCAGSGWATINAIPEGLRATVIRKRTRLASERTAALLDRSIPKPSTRDPEGTIRQYRLLLLKLDRQMGVFENMLLATRTLRTPSREIRSALASILNRCMRLALRVEKRTAEIMRAMSEAHRVLARSGLPKNATKSELLRRAEYYDSLGDPDATLAGTGLEHPFLHRAITGTLKNSQTP